MKFKEKYKEMTDEIYGDRALLHSILNGEAKKQKSFFYNFAHSRTLATVAACFLLVTTGLVSYSVFNHSDATPEISSPDTVSDLSDMSKSIRIIDALPPDVSVTNSEYYGDVLNRIFALSKGSDLTSVGDEQRLDPLDINIEYPSEDVFSIITISRNDTLSSLVPKASHSIIDGVYIAVLSRTDADEKEILENLTK